MERKSERRRLVCFSGKTGESAQEKVEYQERAEYIKKYWDEAVSRLESL